MNKLEACPFCGNNVSCQEIEDKVITTKMMIIYCEICRLHMYGNSLKFLIKKWNQRDKHIRRIVK